MAYDARIRRQGAVPIIIGVLLLVASVAVAPRPVAHAAEGPPRRGGVLLAVIGADPPSLDPHQESTFANIQLVAPLYSTLLQLDPYNYPKIIGDVATEWKIAPDGLTYTFKIRPGIRFHDGSPLTAADVKATYDKIVFPPQGVRSIRKNAYTAVAAGRGPRRRAPWCSSSSSRRPPCWPTWPRRGTSSIPKKYLDQDPNYFKTHVVGSGPFKFKSYTRGLDVRGRAQPRLLRQGPAVPRRLQVLHQPGDVRAGGGHPVGARLHRVPRPAQRRGGGDQEAARRQGRRPGDADDRPVGHRDQQHREAVHRRARPQGAHAGHRSVHDGQGAVPAHRASSSSGR